MAERPSMSGFRSLALCNNDRHEASFYEVMLALCVLSKLDAFLIPLQICRTKTHHAIYTSQANTSLLNDTKIHIAFHMDINIYF